MEVIAQEAHRQFDVPDETHIGLLRRAVGDKARAAGLNSELVGKAELVATEIATNLVKHAAQTGKALLRGLGRGGCAGVEIIAIDNGPGMHVDTMLLDGVSTSGTLGTGLGAIRRLSSQFDIYSQPGVGTGVISRIWSAESGCLPMATKQTVGGVAIAIPGEDACGDGWAVGVATESIVITVVDGLGHGSEARFATDAAMLAFFQDADNSPADILRSMHQSARATRGVVAAVARIDEKAGKLRYCGVGNVSCKIVSTDTNSGCVSLGGIIGLNLPQVKEFAYSFQPGSKLIAYTDGIKSSVSAASIPQCDPTLAAAIILRDHWRTTDDAAVVIAETANSHVR